MGPRGARALRFGAAVSVMTSGKPHQFQYPRSRSHAVVQWCSPDLLHQVPDCAPPQAVAVIKIRTPAADVLLSAKVSETHAVFLF